MRKCMIVIFSISLSVFFYALNVNADTQITEEQIKIFRSAKTVKIVLEQSYGDINDVTFPFKDVTLPFEDVIKSVLKYANLSVVGSDAKNYDLELNIQARGKAIRIKYKGYRKSTIQERGDYHYSGALLIGMISLLTETDPIYSKPFIGKIDPPSIIHKDHLTVISAPFKGAFEIKGSFVSTLIDLMGEIFGAVCLITILKEEDELFRIYAIQSLGKLKDAISVEPLIESLRDDIPYVRSDAARSLGELSDLRAVKPLIAALSDNDSMVREAIVWALGKLASPHVSDLLGAAMKNEDNDIAIRKNVAMALGKIDDPNAREVLLAGVKDDDKEIRYWSMFGLGYSKDSRVFDLLFAAMKDEGWELRIQAAESLGKIDDPRAIEALLACMKDDDRDIRFMSVFGLGNSKDPRAIEALIRALGEGYTRDNARVFLKNKTGRDFLYKQKRWKKWWEANKELYRIKK